MLNSNAEMVNAEVSWEMADQLKAAGLNQVRYRAVWRSHNLIILPLDCHPFRQLVSAVMEGDRDRLLACLRRSPVRCLLLSPSLKAQDLNFWAGLGHSAGRLVYLRCSSSRLSGLARFKFGFYWLVNALGAAGLLLVLSPLLLFISFRIFLLSGQIFERDWRVGARGRLFLEIRFHLPLAQKGEGIASLGRWLEQSRLTRFPQLINVLRGEIGLVGTRAMTLDEVVELRTRLGLSPKGVPGMWERERVQRSADYSETLNLVEAKNDRG